VENILGVELRATQMSTGQISKDKIDLIFSVKIPSDAAYSQVLERLNTLMKKLFYNETIAIDIGVPPVVDVKTGII
jgi:predicted NBD/HSP70 family sugar kinase